MGTIISIILIVLGVSTIAFFGGIAAVWIWAFFNGLKNSETDED